MGKVENDDLSKIVCESIREFSDECRNGKELSEDKVKVFREMMIDLGHPPWLVDAFINLLRDQQKIEAEKNV